MNIFPKALLETEADTWYRLKVTVKGDLIQGFIDGELMCEFNDPRYPSGSVGLGVAGVEVMFDDFMVTGPGISNNGSDFSVTSKGKIAAAWGDIKHGK